MKDGTMEDTVVSVQGLSHSYGKLRAVDKISFDIKKGQIFSFLGPNGAGKTTTINLLITLMPIQEGKVTIAGFDVAKEKGEVRKSIGVVFQDQRLDRDSPSGKHSISTAEYIQSQKQFGDRELTNFWSWLN